MFVSPAFAVDKDIVGNESDAALICGEGLLRRYCCCAAAACRRAACAVSCSLLFGEPEKKDVSLVAFENDVLRIAGFSDVGAVTVVAGAAANGLGKPRRGIVEFDSSINCEIGDDFEFIICF